MRTFFILLFLCGSILANAATGDTVSFAALKTPGIEKGDSTQIMMAFYDPQILLTTPFYLHRKPFSGIAKTENYYKYGDQYGHPLDGVAILKEGLVQHFYITNSLGFCIFRFHLSVKDSMVCVDTVYRVDVIKDSVVLLLDRIDKCYKNGDHYSMVSQAFISYGLGYEHYSVFYYSFIFCPKHSCGYANWPYQRVPWGSYENYYNGQLIRLDTLINGLWRKSEWKEGRLVSDFGEDNAGNYEGHFLIESYGIIEEGNYSKGKKTGKWVTRTLDGIILKENEY